MKENLDNWMVFLDPENLKGNLIASSLFIATFESFTDYVIEEVKFFYNTGFDEKGFTFSSNYEKDVLAKDKKIITASLLWLKEQGAINDFDIEKFNEVRRLRNKVTHELMNLLFQSPPSELPELFVDIFELRVKIERWWIINIEIPTNPDFLSNDNINEEDIITSSQMIYRLIMDLLSNNEKTANFYRNEFLKYKIHKN